MELLDDRGDHGIDPARLASCFAGATGLTRRAARYPDVGTGECFRLAAPREEGAFMYAAGESKQNASEARFMRSPVKTGVQRDVSVKHRAGVQAANNFLATHRASLARCGPSTSEPARAPSNNTMSARAVAFASLAPPAVVHSRNRSANHAR